MVDFWRSGQAERAAAALFEEIGKIGRFSCGHRPVNYHHRIAAVPRKSL
jgi:hypothetical protein